jgi:DNA (cytosine-5)-methyltransferase 1
MGIRGIAGVNFLSVFSGIEAASVAWEGLGFNPVGFAEIDPFSCAVLSHRFPRVKNYGDINNFKEWEIEKTIDIMVGGSPCQSFSFAGNRKGSNDERGKLMFTYGNLVNYFKPRWLVWENVPGVLSSNGGHDFKQLLCMLEKYGYGLVWRILDAQYFGIPQRRRRVFLVGYIGDIRRSAAVLFDFDGRPRNSAPFKTQGESSGRITGNPEISVYNVHQNDSKITKSKGLIDTITQRWGSGGGNTAIVFNKSFYAKYTKNEIAATLLGESNARDMVNLTIDNGLLRKITPREAERLQGFPDNWTKISYKNKTAEQCPDSLRYKAIGNSMAVPVMRWIGNRILHVENTFNGDCA